MNCTFNLPLDRFDVKIVLLSWDEVGSHDSDLLSSGDGTREDTTEGVETSFVGSRYHLGHVHHKWTGWVTSLQCCGKIENNVIVC